MKTKQVFVLLMLCMATQGSRAQFFYIGLGGGYGFPAAKQSFGEDSKSVQSSSGGYSEYTAHPASFGSGINAGLFFGYMLNSNMGFELGASYLMGSKTEFKSEYSNSDINGGVYSSEQTSVYEGKMMRLVPSLRLSVGDKKLRPYMKVGLIVSVGNKLINEQNYKSSYSFGGSSSNSSSREYTGGIGLGFHGGLGINYLMNEKFMLFAECAANYQSWAPLKGTLTKSIYNGIDQLATADKAEKEIEFVDSYTEDSNAAYNPNEPSKATKFYLPFSSIGLNIGLVMSFGKKSE